MFNPNNLPVVGGSQTISGEMSLGDAADLRKALEAGYGSDVASLQGGGALRIQSLDKTMMSTIQENRHFRLFNELQKTNATATVDEYTEQSGVGGFLGGSTNTETGNIASSTGEYARRVGVVKYLMTRREVSFVVQAGNNLVDAQAIEAQNGALQLLTDAEYLCFDGDSSIVPTEFDGINAQIKSLNSADHIIDAEAATLDSFPLISKASATVSAYRNFGMPTHLFTSQLTQSDLDANLDPAYRVSLDSMGRDVVLGAPVSAIRTSWGNISVCPDVFVLDEPQRMPFQVDYSAEAVANDTFKPAAVAPVASAGSASSKWAAAHAGNYYYAVAGVNAAGQSTVLVSAQVAVAAGNKVTITIDRSVAATETGYVIYRGRKDGTNGVTDFRFMDRVAVAGAQTVYVDENNEIPGTSRAYLLNMKPGMNAITWRQYLPMTKFPLYPTVSAVIPWAQLLFGYLRVAKRKQHVVVKNILPSGAVWRPFG
ncbi:MAG: hypothetical protein ACU843_15180 [Gammaproteobacteria bacterium]